MRNPAYLTLSLLMCVSANAKATDVREDPFAYEDRERKKDREREEEAEAAPKHSFGNSGELVLSAERLVGYAHTTYNVIIKGAADERSTFDQMHALVNPGDNAMGFSTPRLAFDVFVTTGLSLGGAVGYGRNTNKYAGKQSLFLASPRIGYAIMFGDVVGLWPRVGATYQVQDSDPSNAWLLAATADLPLVLVAGGHAAVTLGPRMDIGIVGKQFPQGGGSNKVQAREFGFSAGLSLFF